jgi:hypothetical protein
MRNYLTIALMFIQLSLIAQNPTEYQLETQLDTITKVNYSISLPESWSLINQTEGTPYDLIGFELLGQNSITLDECSKNMRLGISIFHKTLDETLEFLGLIKSDNNLYLFNDVDGYINIIVITEIENLNEQGVYFKINKLSNCLINNSKSGKNKNKRNTIDKTYILHSRGDVTICLESFNGVFSENAANLLKTKFNFKN